MIATISPEAQHSDESISTCHFAQRVALVKNEASINEEVEPEMVIERLRAEVKRLRDEVAFLQGKGDDDSDGEDDAGNLPQHELNELTEAVKKYVDDRDERAQLDFCGGITLPKIKAVTSIFKAMLHSNEWRARSDAGNSNAGSESDNSSSTEDDLSASRSDSNHRKHNSKSIHKVKKTNKEQPRKKPDSKPKIRKVCSVPYCSDQQILDDPNSAFTWFKDRYPGLSALEENKASLKTKYIEVGCL
jgi:kinesin family protein 6/9